MDSIYDNVFNDKNVEKMDLEECLRRLKIKECEAMEVYTDMFKLDNEPLYIQMENEPSNPDEPPKANPLLYYKNENEKKGHYRILFKDRFEEFLKEGQNADFSLLNGVTYLGKKNTLKNANKMFAFILDLDGVTSKTLATFIYGTGYYSSADIYPMPNYIILSGDNVHLYYIFDEPISLYPEMKNKLKSMKYNLIATIWNKYTSIDENVQFQGINQGFRCIGGKAKKRDLLKRSKAFRLNEKPFVISDFNEYVDSKNEIKETAIYKETKYTLKAAKEKFPDWYEEKIIKGKNNKEFENVKKWDIKGKVNGERKYALYEWWFKKINSGAMYGNRYFCIMTLAIYAMKNDVPFNRLKNDAYGLIKKFNDLEPSKPFTEEDVDAALKCYDKKFCTFTIDAISNLTKIEIKKNKRNYRPQAVHLKRIRALRDVDYENGSWRNLDGRPIGSGTKEEEIKVWRKNNPNGRKIDCHRETGISRPTIDKWWNS